jgi:hypothetical protein
MVPADQEEESNEFAAIVAPNFKILIRDFLNCSFVYILCLKPKLFKTLISVHF